MSDKSFFKNKGVRSTCFINTNIILKWVVDFNRVVANVECGSGCGVDSRGFYASVVVE